MLSQWILSVLHTLWSNPAATAGALTTTCSLSGLGAAARWLSRAKDSGASPARWRVALALAWSTFCLSDWILLILLPALQISFSRNVVLPLAASLSVRALLLLGMAAAPHAAALRGQRASTQQTGRTVCILFVAANLVFSVVQLDAYIVEPLWIKVTRLSLSSAQLNGSDPPIRLVQLSDIHIEQIGRRERTLIRQLNRLQPDVIVLTGDYVNLSNLSDPVSTAQFRELVGQFHAPYGIFAVRGTVEPVSSAMSRLFTDTGIQWLEQETARVEIRGQVLDIVGLACSHNQSLDSARLDLTMAARQTRDVFTVLLYHSPDLVHRVAKWDVDLYLTGHTHGGQLRLPIYGAIVTGSVYGRQYVSGRFEEKGLVMYVSQGIGFEGAGMPRARFLCRPEIVVVDLSGAAE